MPLSGDTGRGLLFVPGIIPRQMNLRRRLFLCDAMTDVGTFPTCLIWPMMSAIGGEADKSRPTCLKQAKLFWIMDFRSTIWAI
jgi:hypothetical protein